MSSQKRERNVVVRDLRIDAMRSGNAASRNFVDKPLHVTLFSCRRHRTSPTEIQARYIFSMKVGLLLSRHSQSRYEPGPLRTISTRRYWAERIREAGKGGPARICRLGHREVIYARGCGIGTIIKREAARAASIGPLFTPVGRSGRVGGLSRGPIQI